MKTAFGKKAAPAMGGNVGSIRASVAASTISTAMPRPRRRVMSPSAARRAPGLSYRYRQPRSCRRTLPPIRPASVCQDGQASATSRAMAAAFRAAAPGSDCRAKRRSQGASVGSAARRMARGELRSNKSEGRFFSTSGVPTGITA